MPKVWENKYARDNYHNQLACLVDFGEPVDVRGRKTLEILNAITVVNEPWHHCILLEDRQWNPWIAMSEFLWIMAGRNDIAPLLPYNRNIKEFSDNGKTLYGAYGKRIFDQIDPLIARLKADPSDRRAVLAIWDARSTLEDRTPIDLMAKTKDPPCNNMVYFKLRDNKLHMTVINRSNDIHWGLYAVNLPTFSMLQVYIAARLGILVGTQTHFSNSLHVYIDDNRAAEITDRMLYGPELARPPYPKHSLIFYPEDIKDIKDHRQIAEMCSKVLDGFQVNPAWPKFLKFASYFLGFYREHNDTQRIYNENYLDWVTAGDIFVDRVWKRESASV